MRGSYRGRIEGATGAPFVSAGTRKKYDNIENVVCSFGTYLKSF